MRVIYLLVFTLLLQAGCPMGFASDLQPLDESTADSSVAPSARWLSHLRGTWERWAPGVKQAYNCARNLSLAVVVSFSIYWVASPHIQDWRHGTPTAPQKIELSAEELTSPTIDFIEKEGRLDFLSAYIQQHTERTQVWRLLNLADAEGVLTQKANQATSEIPGEWPEFPLKDSRTFERFLKIDPENKEIKKLERELIRAAIEIHWKQLSGELDGNIPGVSREVTLQDFIMGLETMQQ